MTPEVFFLVLLAAFLHALWNVLVKVDGDGMSAMAVIVTIQAAISVLLIAFVPVPGASGWPFLLSAAVLHTGYRLFLVESYRFGDLGRVYPIARGSSPLIVAVLAMVFAGETTDPQSLAAIFIISVGIMSLSLTRGLDRERDGRAVVLALATGTFAAVYTIVDGLGARHAGSASAYMIWVSLLDAVAFLPVAQFARRGALWPSSAKRWTAGAIAGVTGFAAYWLVVWALTVAPMASVSALRATSIGFVLVFGVVFLKEPATILRSASAIAIAAGTAMLKFGK
ncbi:MAG: DMT family transporter [Rhizobiaceae bacterium]|nr:DMT family transporter [Rhizobiaceae bacterium]